MHLHTYSSIAHFGILLSGPEQYSCIHPDKLEHLPKNIKLRMLVKLTGK
jgi:hypothetical protein